MGGHLPKAGATSLEAMGRAFMNVDGTGNMADVYYSAICELTLLYPVAGADQLMGYTIAHELKHIPKVSQKYPNFRVRKRRKESVRSCVSRLSARSGNPSKSDHFWRLPGEEKSLVADDGAR